MGFLSDFKRVDSVTRSVPYFTLDGTSATRRLSIEKSGALFSSAYLAAEQAKARALGSLPCRVYADGERGREPVRDHPLTALVSKRWNPVMTAQTGWQWVSVRRDTFGTAYVRVQWDRGLPVAFWPIEADVETHFNVDIAASPVRYVVSSGDKFTPAGTYLDREILVFPTCISTDGGVTGRSLAELGAEEIGLSINLTRFYGNVIAKGFHPGGYLEHERKLELDDVRAIAAKNAVLSGPDHAGELRIFDQGLKYHALSASMAEADIVKQEEFILQSVGRVVYVQPNKMFDFSRATYSNIEEAAIAFVTDTMTPEVTALEGEVNKILAFMGQPGAYVKFNMRGLLRGDFKSQMEGFVAGIYGGVYGRDEVRDLQDLPYRDGTERLLQPLNMTTADDDTGTMIKRASSAGVLVRSGYEPAAVLETVGLPEMPYTEVTPVTVRPNDDGAQAKHPLTPVLADARSRIADRVAKDGATPKTREFARTVLAPVAQAFALAGIEFDIDHETEEAISGQA